MSKLESSPSNPVSHASGEADTPFCWVIVATGNHGEWIVDICASESEADGVLASRGSGYAGVTYRKEPLCLGSTLSSLRAEHDAHASIFRWLLGEEGEFPESLPGRRYNFRTELRARLKSLENSDPRSA